MCEAPVLNPIERGCSNYRLAVWCTLSHPFCRIVVFMRWFTAVVLSCWRVCCHVLRFVCRICAFVLASKTYVVLMPCIVLDTIPTTYTVWLQWINLYLILTACTSCFLRSICLRWSAQYHVWPSRLLHHSLTPHVRVSHLYTMPLRKDTSSAWAISFKVELMWMPKIAPYVCVLCPFCFGPAE